MEKAILKSMEGRWKPTWYFCHFNDDEAVFGDINKDDENNPCYYLNIYKIFSSPLFWQCLGKGLKRGYVCDDCGEGFLKPRDNCMCGESYPPAKVWWEYAWHRFIDHLIEGKDPEEFFNNLLADN